MTESRKLQKHTLNLFEGDFDKLKTITKSNLGASLVVRHLVAGYLEKIERGLVPASEVVKELENEAQ